LPHKAFFGFFFIPTLENHEKQGKKVAKKIMIIIKIEKPLGH